MPAFDKSAYDQQYARRNIVRKQLPFNRTVPEDQKMLQWLEQQGNITQYIKGLILRDIETCEKRDR